MIHNYIKTAVRHLFKQKGLAFINIFGLSIGLACFCLFLLYAVHEFSFDRFHADGDKIHRVYRWTADMDGEGIEGDPYLPMPLGPAMKDDLPDVESYIRWKGAWGESFVRIDGKIRKAEVSHVDDNIFEFFSFPLKYGVQNLALSDPRNVVLTEETAMRLFGESNPTGKTIDIQIEGEFEEFTISGIAENVPSNSTNQFQILGSMEFFKNTRNGRRRDNNWYSSFLNTYIKIKEGSGLASNESALLQFRRKYYPDEEQELRAAGRWEGEGPPVMYRLQELNDIHTFTLVGGGDIPPVNRKNIWTLLAIAAGVLLIAIINFTTLSIGRSAGRAKEVGIRKVMGGYRKQLIGQFLSESVLLSLLSLVIGLGLAQLLLPYFNEISGRQLSFSIRLMPELPWLIAGIALITGLLAGSYPAFMLSRFKPVEVLKNKIRLGGSNLFTKSLVTTQFALSSGLVVATLIIISQLNFLRNKNPGFQKENVIAINAEGTASNTIYPLFKEAISQDPEVIGIASSELGLGAGMGWSRSGFDFNGELKQVYEYFVDDDYLNVMGIEVLRGRGFEPDRQDGPNMSVIINETMMTDFGWSLDNAVGQELAGYSREGNQPKVIGVVKDFHFRSFREAVRPQMFHQFTDYEPFVYYVKIKAGNPGSLLANMESHWAELAPGYPFAYTFLDEDLDRFYRSEERFGQIVTWAGGISILLACLGLLGLAALAAINRTKEIGIRKVLGASMLSIVSLLSADFIKLVLFALVISIPVTWYLISGWLENFAFRIGLQWWTFGLAAAIAILLALLPVSFQGIKAALVNPVDSLRNE